MAPAMRILYVVYWGAAEPLGRSLVVPAVCRLARAGIDFTLVSFEKPRDLENAAEIAAIERQFADAGVRWVPLRYHKSPKWPATAYDIVNGVVHGLAARWLGRFDIVHARTFVGGPMGAVLATLLRAKLVYHNEGFYPDEQVDGGVWRAESWPHRIAKSLERFLYTRADAVVVLSERGRSQVRTLLDAGGRATPLAVVPSAVDLGRFHPRTSLARILGEPLRLVYIGSVGLRYLLDRVGRFVSILARRVPVELRVFSGASRDLIGALLSHGGLSPDAWSCEWIPHSQVPAELERSHAGLFFLTQGLSEHGCSPTKFGEYWAAGLPVVTTPNVSDSEEIILAERVGVVVRGHSDVAYEQAADDLLALLDDPGLPGRCRRAAEAHYGLERACQRLTDLYRAVVHPPDSG